MAEAAHKIEETSHEHEVGSSKVPAEHSPEAGAMEKITNPQDEKPIMNIEEFAEAAAFVRGLVDKENAAQKAREQASARPHMNKRYVDLLVSSFEISQSEAERLLVEHSGKFVSAVLALTK